jgi:hypothetical protein
VEWSHVQVTEKEEWDALVSESRIKATVVVQGWLVHLQRHCALPAAFGTTKPVLKSMAARGMSVAARGGVGGEVGAVSTRLSFFNGYINPHNTPRGYETATKWHRRPWRHIDSWTSQGTHQLHGHASANSISAIFSE